MSWDARDRPAPPRALTPPPEGAAGATPRVALLTQLQAGDDRAQLWSLALDGPERWPEALRRTAAELGLWEPQAWQQWARLVTRGISAE